MYGISHKKVYPASPFYGCPLNGTETERPFPLRSFLLHLRVKVLQLKLANTAPGFVLRRLSAFPQQKQQNQQNLWWLGLCIMYYGLSCARTEKRPDVARKQNRNYRSVVQTYLETFL